MIMLRTIPTTEPRIKAHIKSAFSAGFLVLVPSTLPVMFVSSATEENVSFVFTGSFSSFKTHSHVFCCTASRTECVLCVVRGRCCRGQVRNSDHHGVTVHIYIYSFEQNTHEGLGKPETRMRFRYQNLIGSFISWQYRRLFSRQKSVNNVRCWKGNN